MYINYSQKLEEDRKESSKQGNYEIAEQLRVKVEELRVALDITIKRELQQKHSEEVNKIEYIFKSEVEELEMRYDNGFQELDAKSKAQEEKIVEKHQNEMEELYNYLDMKLPKIVKYSKKYLDLKTQEMNLAKQQKYKDALLIKKECEGLDKLDTKRFNKEKTDKIKSQSIKTANRHLNEKNAFKKKIELEFEELKKRKEIELNTLLLKYRNRKNELENQQKQEQIIYGNKYKLKASKSIILINLVTTKNKIRSKQYLFNTSHTNFNSQTIRENDHIEEDNEEEDQNHGLKYQINENIENQENDEKSNLKYDSHDENNDKEGIQIHEEEEH